MHGVAAQTCGQVSNPLLGGETGGRAPGFIYSTDYRPAPASAVVVDDNQFGRGPWHQKLQMLGQDLRSKPPSR
jgi:hypothetical protein